MFGGEILVHFDNTLVDGYIEFLIDSFFVGLYMNSCVRIFVIQLSYDYLILQRHLYLPL
jgi:hypothetical protein